MVQRPLTRTLLAVLTAVNLHIAGLGVFIILVVDVHLVHPVGDHSQLGCSILVCWNLLAQHDVLEPGVIICQQFVADQSLLHALLCVVIRDRHHNEGLLVADDGVGVRIELKDQNWSTESAVHLITVH